jgi:hypothetical protein
MEELHIGRIDGGGSPYKDFLGSFHSSDRNAHHLPGATFMLSSEVLYL